MNVVWKDIPGYEGYYQVSNEGDVRSLDRVVHTKDNRELFYFGRYMTKTDNNGYQQVRLRKNSGGASYGVHQLVGMAFLGYEPTGRHIVIDHINNIRTDNRLENLQIITQRDNILKINGSYTPYKDKYGKYKSQIQIDNKIIYLGYFDTYHDASDAYKKAKINYERNYNI